VAGASIPPSRHDIHENLCQFGHEYTAALVVIASDTSPWGCVSAIDSNGRTIFVADAHRDDGKRFVVRAGEKLIAFVELESVTCGP
jgi:hypothetical protein